MGSAVNQRAVETYAIQMYAELAALLQRTGHPLALDARSLADRVALPSTDQKTIIQNPLSID